MTLQHLAFFLSGAAALVYEVLWARELALVFGYTVYSVSTVLAAIMAGFALGSWAGSAWARRARSPWGLYGRIELGVALFAALVPWSFALLRSLIEAWGLPPLPVRFAIAFCLLTPASLLMGATFPVLGRAARPGHDPGGAIGGLYAANLLGACFGAGASAFLGLAFLGVSRTYAVAVGMTLVAGAIALATPSRGAETSPVPAPEADTLPECSALFVSGFCGMAFEVLWTRLLVPSFSNSSYGFASVLVVFLAGSGVGSAAASRLRLGSRATLGGALVACAVLSLLSYSVFELTQLLQIRLVSFENAGVTPMIAEPLAEAFAVLLPVALVQGAMLPLALRSCGTAGSGAVPAALGRLYAWNTLGAIAGSLAAGFWWIPQAGAQKSMLIVVAAGIASGTALLLREVRQRSGVLLTAGACLAFAWLRLGGESLPYRLLLDWTVRTPQGDRKILFYKEDIEAAVMADARGGLRFLVINGAGASGYDNVTKLLAHIPLALHPAPERALVVCFGMGTTFRSAMSHPVKVDAVELVPSVLEAFPVFYPDAAQLAADPRARLLVNDGRNHLLVEKDGYDVIMLDPQPPLYAAGTANLYNRDFFALARRRLKPHGLLAVWLPTCPESEFNMVMRSFADAMPYTQLWRSRVDAPGMILLGSPDPIVIDRRRAESRLKAPKARKDLLEFNRSYAEIAAFWDLYLGPGESFASLWKTSPSVTDDQPRIEYPYFRSLSPSYYRNPKVLAAPVLPSAH